jgi:hypothetical protein
MVRVAGEKLSEVYKLHVYAKKTMFYSVAGGGMRLTRSARSIRQHERALAFIWVSIWQMQERTSKSVSRGRNRSEGTVEWAGA